MKSLILILLLLTNLAFAKKYDYKVPTEWLENHSTVKEPNPRFSAAVDNIFQANLRPLELTQSDKKWGLRGFIFDLGISAQGVLGVLVTKGASSSTVIWTKKESTVPPSAFEEKSDEAVTLDGGDFTRSLEPLIQSLVKTGRVKDPVELRKNLGLLAEDMEALSVGVHGMHTKNWEISRLRLDISISASGKVGPFASVGGGVKVRLEWFPQQQAIPFDAEPTHRMKTMQASINNTVKNVLLSMEAYDQSEIVTKNSLELSGLRVGLGISSKWRIAVVKNSASAIVYAYFSRSKPKIMGFDTTVLKGESKGFEVIDEEGGIEKLHRIDPKKFQKGIGRATRIGIFLANRSRKMLQNSTWELNQLKTSFEMNSGGDIKLVTINGIVSGEMSFRPLTN